MSVYQFLASNYTIKNIENNYIELFSIEEAEQKEISMPNWYSKNSKIDRQKKIILFCPKEHLEDLEIQEDNDSIYAKQFSKKKFFSSIYYNSNKDNLEKLITHISEHVSIYFEIELWNIWLSDCFDKNYLPIYTTYKASCLNEIDLKEFLETDPFKQPHCLVIKK